MNTRKILSIGIVALSLYSCSTINHTSQVTPIDTQIFNLTVADMNVSAKKDSVTVNWKWNPLSTVSLKAQKESAVHALIGKNDADVIIEPEYIVTRRGIFRGGSVTVLGYPASYTNFRTMSKEDAEKIATINGNSPIVFVDPVISNSSRNKSNKRMPTANFVTREKNEFHRQFINLIGGPTIDIDSDLDMGSHFGIMYGRYNSKFGWYGKLTVSQINSYYGVKWTPSLTGGIIKPFSKSFACFAGLGIGGYFVNHYDYYWYDIAEKKFSIPVELGIMKKFNSFNIMAGATYSTPLGGCSGNIHPFIGLGYTF